MIPVPASAVLLDSLGTLLRLEPPAPRLRAVLEGMGVAVDPAAAEEAIDAEIAYYLEHHTEGRDSSSLAELRNRCAAVVRERASRGVAATPSRFGAVDEFSSDHLPLGRGTLAGGG